MTDRELDIRDGGGVRTITLRRRRQRNALSRELMRRLTDSFGAIRAGDETRVVVLAAEGPVFCAGGDIAEYAEGTEGGDRRANAAALAGLLAAIAACPAPVIARVQGAAYGGGVGLLCAADIAVAADDARFSLSEARLGLVPAAIAPYVLRAMGPRRATAHMLLAAPFDADEALATGVIHRAVPAGELDAVVGEVVDHLLRCSPGALAAIKRLPGLLAASDDVTATVIELHVGRLASAEGREGLRAFLEKRPPSWLPERLREP
jgi:methylglutaconyl-CoA hydratase